MSVPVVSVVTSIWQGAALLERSLASVLDQDLRELELIAVDDGSSDGSAALLDALAARDPRVRVLHQENRGLTAALQRACAAARAPLVARHDADDLSLPGRLRRQVERLRAQPELAFVSCWTRVVGPHDELLLEARRPTDDAQALLRLDTHDEAPVHGSVVFRAAAYERVGGYRTAFRYAQDWDLWLRLAEAGGLAYEPEFLYALRVSPTSISASRRGQQQRLREIARACRAARRQGRSEAELLDAAERLSAAPPQAVGGRGLGASYFIGKCLLDRRDPRCWPYLRQARRERPWAFRPRAALLLARLRCAAAAAAPRAS